MELQGWCYYSSGADDEITLRENHAAYQRVMSLARASTADLGLTCVLTLTLSLDLAGASRARERQNHLHVNETHGNFLEQFAFVLHGDGAWEAGTP